MKSPLFPQSAMILLLAAPACGQGASAAEEVSEPVTSATVALSPAEEGAQREADRAATAALRRAYSAADMKYQSCVTLDQEGTFIGENCPPGLLIFGPYVRVPHDAKLRLNFDVESETPLGVSSDVVSSVGKYFHGAMEENMASGKASRNMGYAIYMFQDADAVEARIWTRSDGPANFKIKNLKLEVQ